jgi:hypothetical protein
MAVAVILEGLVRARYKVKINSQPSSSNLSFLQVSKQALVWWLKLFRPLCGLDLSFSQTFRPKPSLLIEPAVRQLRLAAIKEHLVI